VKFQTTSNFFADGLGARKPVAGTVPVGFEMPGTPVSKGSKPLASAFTHADDYYNTGKFGDYWGDGFPDEIEISEEFLERGRERFDINCAICHGETGNGKGVIARYGVPNIANFHLAQFNDPEHPDYRGNGDVYNTITHGKGLMGAYGANLTVRDRWAIVAYLRALQSSWKMPHKDVSEEFDKNLAEQDAAKKVEAETSP